jgi:hypothetical protein|uniref:Uncharacterized protein n=1 Tax=Zea mays TaxID=4577 RepID=A0A804NFC7_MAIZE
MHAACSCPYGTSVPRPKCRSTLSTKSGSAFTHPLLPSPAAFTVPLPFPTAPTSSPPQSPRRLYHVPTITAAARSHLGYSRPGSSPQSPQRPDPTSPSPWHTPELPASPKIRPRSSIVDRACNLNLHHIAAIASTPPPRALVLTAPPPPRTSSRGANTAPPRASLPPRSPEVRARSTPQRFLPRRGAGGDGGVATSGEGGCRGRHALRFRSSVAHSSRLRFPWASR